MVAIVLSAILLSVLVQAYPVCLWPCTALLGAGYGTVIPSSLLWIGSFMELNGRFSSAFWTGYAVGYMAIPILMGYLFNDVHPMWFVYVTLACAVGMSTTYGALSVVVKHGSRQTEVATHHGS